MALPTSYRSSWRWLLQEDKPKPSPGGQVTSNKDYKSPETVNLFFCLQHLEKYLT